jgi:hypothetical protein
VTKTKHTTGQLAVLDPVVAALQKRGFKASYHCPGYVQIENHDFVYAPSSDHWVHIHTKNHQGPWTRLLDLQDECMDAEQIANKILAHISSSAKGNP